MTYGTFKPKLVGKRESHHKMDWERLHNQGQCFYFVFNPDAKLTVSTGTVHFCQKCETVPVRQHKHLCVVSGEENEEKRVT